MGSKVQRVPSESCESIWFYQWAIYNHLPVIHIPNEGRRSKQEGARLKRMGLSRGFPDFVIFIGSKGYHGLVIEMKRSNATIKDVRSEQQRWLDELNNLGYYATWSPGWVQAKGIVEKYLGKTLKD